MTITNRAAIVLQEIYPALEETVFELCVHCEGVGGISYNPNLNPSAFPAMATAKCNHCNGTGKADSRTLLPTSLRCLKTAIEGLLYSIKMANSIIGITWGWDGDCGSIARAEDIRDSSTDRLTTLCDQWEAGR